MDKIKNNLNIIGTVLLFAALAGLKIWPQKKTVAFIVALIGVAALAVYIGLHLSSLKKSFKRRAFLYSGNMLLIVFLVLAILVLINTFLSKHHYRADFTSSKLHSLSDASIKVVKNTKKDISIRCFFREGNYNRASMENLMKIYAYQSGKIKYEFIDPDKNPGLIKRYEITQDGTTIFEAGDKESRITTSSEEDITNALIKVTRDKKKILYFLEGHGESSIEESGENGYSQVKGELEKMGYEVKKLALALSENFPEDCALLFIPCPKKAFLANEIETLKRYIGQGGRVFFMIDPETDPGLIPLLNSYGVKVENDLIVDTVSRLFGGDYFMPVISEYEPHEITKNFRYATFYPVARSVDAAASKPEGASVTVLAKTSPNSWSERQLDQKQVKFDSGKDEQGPIPLALVETIKVKAEKKTEASQEAPVAGAPEKDQGGGDKEARLAVFGDSDFASNRYLNLSGNANFFLNAVNWLTEEADLISIQPRTSSPRTIQLSPSQGRMIFFVAVILLPLFVLFLGMSVWLRRKSL